MLKIGPQTGWGSFMYQEDFLLGARKFKSHRLLTFFSKPHPSTESSGRVGAYDKATVSTDKQIELANESLHRFTKNIYVIVSVSTQCLNATASLSILLHYCRHTSSMASDENQFVLVTESHKKFRCGGFGFVASGNKPIPGVPNAWSADERPRLSSGVW